jgi:large subunit ribosomal protein L21
MYAIVEQGGKQYKVAEGDRVDIELTEVEEGAKTLEMTQVLMISDGENVKIGTPYLTGAKVVATFGESPEEAVIKGPELYPTHFRRRKNSRRRIGHRQKYLRITVDKIEG